MSHDEKEQNKLPHGAEDFLARKRTAYLVENFKPALFVSLFNSVLVWGIFRFQIGTPEITFWLALNALVNVLRGFLILSLPKDCVRLPTFHDRSLLILTLFAGILCAFPVFLIPADANSIYAHLNIILVAGMTAAASHSYSTHPRLMVAFVPPALIVLVLYYFQTSVLLASFTSAFFIIYVLGMFNVTRRVSRTFELAINNEWEAVQQRAELATSQTELHQQIREKESSQADQAEQIEKIRRFNNALDKLYIRHSFHQNTPDLLYRDCLETVSKILDVERISIWCFTDSHDALKCTNLYQKSQDKHLSSDVILNQKDFPVYFSCLRENRVIVAADAESNPQTAEFCNNYFKPNKIRSLLDAPIQSHNGVSGVVCCESVGEQRDWQADEISFLASIAQLISIRVFTDRSAKLNEDLKTALRTAQEADRAKADFMATMNHELRTPMNGVLGAASILDQSDIDEEHSRLTRAILQSGGVMMALLNDMLDFSKFEAGRIDLENVAFPIGKALEEVSATHYYSATEKGLTFDHKFELPEHLQLMGDPHRLTQILHNLISNAVKFTQQGEIKIEAIHTDDNGLKIIVRDSGIGIAQDRLEKVFKPFFQADSSTTRQFGGTGLGLAIVEKLVTAMNGVISIDSEVGVGTTIEIELPLIAAREIAAPQSKNTSNDPNNQHPLAGSTFLIADDNRTNLLVLTVFLEKAGAKTMTALNGQEAVDLCQSTVFDAVLMDIHMPVMDGIEAMLKIRAEGGPNGNTTPIFAVTADAMPEQVKKYLSLGFDNHIPKPIRPDEAIDKLSKLSAQSTITTSRTA